MIDQLWLEYRQGQRALGVGEPRPRLSWTLTEGAAQESYEIEIAYADGTSYRTGVVNSSESRLVDWPAEPLESRQQVELRVRACGPSEPEGPWSSPLVVEGGLFHESDWKVDFVSPSVEAAQGPARPAFLLRAKFRVEGQFTQARLYVTAHGAYEMEANGRRTDTAILAPGWSSFHHRIRYQTLDLTSYIQTGDNVIGAWLADGWYRGRLGFNGGRWDNYGSDVSLLAQLEITRADGSVELVDLRDAWRWSSSPIISTGLYEGEFFDSRQLAANWSAPGFDDTSEWRTPTVLSRSGWSAKLESPTGPPVSVIETLVPKAMKRLPNGNLQFDFGQNISGKLRVRLSGESGREIVIRHAEVLEGGSLALRPLRGASATDVFICSGRDEEWTPKFTIHGFRYAEIENWPGEPREGDITALVVHSDMRRTGWFESSHAQLNRLHENVVWSMRDNFVDLPTDCPQRDERLGWTGDIQVFAPTASYLYDVEGLLAGWLRDVAAEQIDLGSVPNFVPWIECGFPANPSAAWGDAAVMVPWVLYQRFGDTRILRDQYASMKAWVDLVTSRSSPSGLWNEGFQLGDWLDPAAPPENPSASLTDKYLVASAYRVHSTRLLARTAALLGHSDDARRYEATASKACDAFRREFVTPNGRMSSDTATAYSLAITFDLLAPAQREVAGRRLAELVAESHYLVSTGFVGTPIVCDALAATGHVDVAYLLLLQDEMPSWLYAVKMGATTTWERWDSMLPDGSVNPGEMTSFNHYALGAVADFMHRIVGGLAPAAPGYRQLRIAPQPGGGLTSASAQHDTPYGRASTSWTREGDVFHLEVVIPSGVTAEIHLPGGDSDPIQAGPGVHSYRSLYRAASDDPSRPRPFNIHSPSDRAAAAALGDTSEANVFERA